MEGQVVGAGGVPVSPPPMSLRAYARHRHTSATSVLRAIAGGRLKDCLVRVNGVEQIGDVALADAEWERHTDLSRAPGYVKERAAVAASATGAPAGDLPLVSATTGDSGEEPGPVAARRGMSVTEASAAEKYWKAKLAELDYQTKMGELVSASAVAIRVAQVFSLCRTKLLAVPSKAKSAMPDITHAQIATLDGLIRQALEDLAATEAVVAPSDAASDGEAA
jgi:hypothetical protein